MVLTHTTTDTYHHPFPTVTLAFFLRYCSPQLNPFAKHVLSTDTISSHVDPTTGRLHTTRIHLKKSRLPGAVLKLLPASVTGGVADKASYVLETSVVDIREGWMQTESRNLNFTGVLSVIEQQRYAVPASSAGEQLAARPATPSQAPPTTDVETTVVFRSRIGERIERIRERIGQGPQSQQQAQVSVTEQHGTDEQRGGWFGRTWVAGLGTKGIQRSIETIASSKTVDQLSKSREGMRVVLERLRKTGVIGVLELRRKAMEGRLEA